jgi:glutamyl-tRNA reductase
VEKAEKIAEKYNIPHIAMEDLDSELKHTDILIVATGAAHPIINKSHFPNGKETLVIDLSIPHNVEKDITENPNVKLVDVDELSAHISETMTQRKKEIPKAEEIIKEMTKDFTEWEKKRKMAPKIHHFKAVLKNMERNEMHHIHRKHRYVGVEDMELSDKMIQKITNRFAKYIIDHPWKAEEISKLMHEILVEQPHNEFNEKH